MPRHNWPTDPGQLVRSFETKYANPVAGALFAWAARCVDSLHYLDDIDIDYDIGHSVVGGHNPDIVDVSHARWATATSITALDLCAAGLGRAFCSNSSDRELAMPDFDPSRSFIRSNSLRGSLPGTVCKWVDGVFFDRRYNDIKAARNWLTHARVRRHFTLATGGPPQRLELTLGSRQIGARDIVETSRDLATQHVSALLTMLPSL
jgi:hypothetical protein